MRRSHGVWLPLALVAVSCCPASECAGPPSRACARRECGAGTCPVKATPPDPPLRPPTDRACPAPADRAGLAATLADHGVAFFPNAFSKDECELLIQQFVDNCEVNEVRWLVLWRPRPRANVESLARTGMRAPRPRVKGTRRAADARACPSARAPAPARTVLVAATPAQDYRNEKGVRRINRLDKDGEGAKDCACRISLQYLRHPTPGPWHAPSHPSQTLGHRVTRALAHTRTHAHAHAHARTRTHARAWRAPLSAACPGMRSPRAQAQCDSAANWTGSTRGCWKRRKQAPCPLHGALISNLSSACVCSPAPALPCCWLLPRTCTRTCTRRHGRAPSQFVHTHTLTIYTHTYKHTHIYTYIHTHVRTCVCANPVLCNCVT